MIDLTDEGNGQAAHREQSVHCFVRDCWNAPYFTDVASLHSSGRFTIRKHRLRDEYDENPSLLPSLAVKQIPQR